ncbi:MAG: hypothetical protein AB8D52_06880 [Gammaproteobacteria bacterium]
MKLLNLPFLKILLVTYLVSVEIQVVTATDNVAPELHIDPFVNPMVLQPPLDSLSVDDQGKPMETVQARETFLWQPELRGIIRSEDVAIANMAGELIELGMEFEGYRLIKVREQSVVFEKDGKKYPVSIDGTEEQESTL